MLKYLIIPLGSHAVSYCYYNTPNTGENEFISPEILKEAIMWGMKENLSFQFVYPYVAVPEEIDRVVGTIDHVKIVPAGYPVGQIRRDAGVIVFDNYETLKQYELKKEGTYLLRTGLHNLIESISIITGILPEIGRLNIVTTDIAGAGEKEFDAYSSFLNNLVPFIVEEYSQGHSVQLNLITDRAMLNHMNNCNAGVESVTLSHQGEFHICPAFIGNGEQSIGSLQKGIEMKNRRLLDIKQAPICKVCDAYQCKRCVWLNKKLTHEFNTPGFEQCIMSHIERNASRLFLDSLHSKCPEILPDISIPEINYMDPLDKLEKF